MSTTSHQESAALRQIRETVDSAASKVFGEPIHHDGVTVVPVAAVATGGGGGGGSTPMPKGKGRAEGEGAPNDAGGEGGGFGVVAKPAGAFVIKDGTVTWRPAVNATRVVMGGQVVAVVALLVIRAIVKARTKRRPRRAGMRMLARRRHAHAHGR